MANARPSTPSRIGKTLGAILSAPRRAAADDADEAGTAGTISPPVQRTSEPDAEPDAGPGTDAGSWLARASTAGSPAADAAADAAAAITPAATHPDRTGPAATAAPSTARATGEVASPAPAPRVTAADVDAGATPGSAARRKKRETFLIPEALADAMRNAIVHLSGPPLYYTLAEFGEHAIRNYIAELEREHNGGRPFPQRPRSVRQGRPLR